MVLLGPGPVRLSTYSRPPGRSSIATRPPCFWKPGTAAGEVFNTRQGALPAVMAAPMTSSGLAGRDLLARDLLVGMGRVPSADHRLGPGHLLLVVRVPDLDRATGGGCFLREPPPLPPHAAASAVTTMTTGTRRMFMRVSSGRGSNHQPSRFELDIGGTAIDRVQQDARCRPAPFDGVGTDGCE